MNFALSLQEDLPSRRKVLVKNELLALGKVLVRRESLIRRIPALVPLAVLVQPVSWPSGASLIYHILNTIDSKLHHHAQLLQVLRMPSRIPSRSLR